MEAVTAYRQSTPVPISSSSPVGSNRVYSIPLWLKPGTTSIKIKAANRTYAAGTGTPATIDFSVYTSDGAENPVGGSFGDFVGQVIPGNGAFSTQTSSIPVTRGPDGKIVIVYSFPDPTFAFVANVKLGKYKLGTTTVNPPPAPGAWDGDNLNPVFWWDVDSDDGGSRAFDVDGDSISVEYSASGGNFDGAAWNVLAQRRNYAVHIQGAVQYGSLQNLANSGGLPYLHDDRLSATGKTKILQLGTNDGAYNDLAVMQAALVQCITDAVAAGYSKIYAWTVPPVAGYPAFNIGVRLTFNAWLLANFVSLGLTGVYDAAAPQSQGGLAEDGDPLTLAAAFDSGDGSHPNDAGQVQIADGWDLTLGIPVAAGSLARVLAALRRLYPPALAFQSDASDIGLERNVIGGMFARGADLVESIFDEAFPDTTTKLIDRWEKVTRSPTVPTDDITVRRQRPIAVLRRTSGPRIAQLEQMLTGPLALDPSDMVWVEGLRSDVEERMIQGTGVVSLSVPNTAPGRIVVFEQYRPGVVDDTGVLIYISVSSVGTTVATLTHPDGTVWTIPVNATSGWYFTRSVFTGKKAAGPWYLTIRDSTSPTLTEAKLLVSDNVDTGAIYQFYVLRDPTLPGTADLNTAQRLFHRTALGNMKTAVVETLAFKCDDTYSRCDRDPLGV